MSISTIRLLFLASLIGLALSGCKPPSGGWNGYSNDNPYALPEYHGGYTPM